MRSLTTFLIIAAVVLAAGQLTILLLTVSPYEASRVQLFGFFSSVLIVLAGALVALLYPAKRWFVYRGRAISLTSTVRQAALAAAVLTTCLFLQSLRLLSVWETVPLVVAVALTEAFFQADRRTPLHPDNHAAS